MDETVWTISDFQAVKLDSPYQRQTLSTMGQELMTKRSPSSVSAESSADEYFSLSDDDSTPAPSTSVSTAASVSGDIKVLHLPPQPSYLAQKLECFQREMDDRQNARVSSFRNTYFFDGRSRFISLPTLGNSNTKAASQISRMFEEWLERKIYVHDAPDMVPILEESVEVSAAEIMAKLKSKATKIFNGLSKVMIKIRVGHASTYLASPVSPLTTSPASSVSSYSWNEQEDDDRMALDDSMDDFFQQFPLFVEVIIRVKPTETKLSPSTHLLLTVENAGFNPDRPFMMLEEIDYAGVRA
ncbi:hypothetical protein BC937DRAFT_86391 [Endogone sp. FLAS-F59071]|nr:hypothetical protein BC937DRAFT_86391 [Endogone sp. FLAS-F59071]|eukprot:RUS13070.1 hypothetical protein BC937DRAFT_86391 [Endogone sp. FLAS-F59071]